MANWWDKYVGPSPTGGMGARGAEAQEIVKARQANQDGRDTFHNLANIYRTASKYPGGIPNVTVDALGNAVGSKSEDVQNYALFRAQNGQAAISQAKLLAPVSNSDFQNLMSFGPNPGLRFENNKQLIGQAYETAARRYFENAFKQRFAARHGSLEATDAQGRTYPQALANAMARPEVAQELMAPWKRASWYSNPGGKAVQGDPWANATIERH